MKLSTTLLSVLMAGGLMAQTPAPAPSSAQDHLARRAAAVNRSGWMLQRLTKRLDLTADQQARAKAIFADSRQQSKALAPRLREERSALKAAIQSDSESQIDLITAKNAQLTAQIEAVHVKAMAKVYAMLTPDQQARFNRMDVRRGRRAG
jgi:Spy/CpxP family protein refolding chaperone